MTFFLRHVVLQVDGESWSEDGQCSLCLDNVTNNSVYVAGAELAYRYCFRPGSKYLLLPNYVGDRADLTSSCRQGDDDETTEFCIRVFAAADITCRYVSRTYLLVLSVSSAQYRT